MRIPTAGNAARWCGWMVAAGVLGFGGPATASVIDSTWTEDDGGAWFDSENWSDGVPDGAGHIARWGSYGGGFQKFEIEIDQDLMLGEFGYHDSNRPIELLSDDPETTRTLTLDNLGSPVVADIDRTAHWMNVFLQVELTAPLEVIGDSDSFASGGIGFNGGFDNSSGHPILVDGDQVGLSVGGDQTWGPGSTLLIEDAGIAAIGMMGENAPANLSIEVRDEGEAQFPSGDVTLQGLHVTSEDARVWAAHALNVATPIQIDAGALTGPPEQGLQVEGDIDNTGGTLSLRSTEVVEIVGDYIQGPLGTLVAAGLRTGLPPIGTLDVTGDVELAGTLIAPEPARGTYPEIGTTFTLIETFDDGLITGSFDTIEQQMLDTDAWWRVDYDDTLVTLTVVPEPGSAALLAAGAVVLLARRRPAHRRRPGGELAGREVS